MSDLELALVKESIADAERFIARANKAIIIHERGVEYGYTKNPCHHKAAMKRASMDLTRSLAQLRRGRP